MLRAYDTIIIDEAHERSLNIDFLLGYLKQLLPQAARAEADRHLGDHRRGALLEALRRRAGDRGLGPALSGGGALPPGRAATTRTRRATRRSRRSPTRWTSCAATGPGDVLVFLPGEREIREAAEALRKHHPPRRRDPAAVRAAVGGGAGARVPARRRAAHRARHQRRRDLAHRAAASATWSTPGLARVKRYSYRNKVEHAAASRTISQASARAARGALRPRGRAASASGSTPRRTSSARPAFTDPEILRSSLAAVILRR